MKPIDKILRVQFCKFMKDKNIGPENIFFTNESVFPLYAYMNKGTNKIRLSRKTRRKLRSGDEKSINLVTRLIINLIMLYWSLVVYVMKV